MNIDIGGAVVRDQGREIMEAALNRGIITGLFRRTELAADLSVGSQDFRPPSSVIVPNGLDLNLDVLGRPVHDREIHPLASRPFVFPIAGVEGVPVVVLVYA